VFEDKRYSYDGHGRLVRKRAGRHTEQRFEWDEESRLVAVHTTRRPGTPEATTQLTRFDYDAMGRRVAKHDAFGSTRFVWEGMRLIEERRGSQVVSYVYDAGSHVPVARLDAKAEPLHGASVAQVFHFHNNPVGLPEELSNSDGNLCWRASYRTWGATVAERWEVASLNGQLVSTAEEVTDAITQNLRFQGQYLDRDTGLHYNTFRFYDPDIGRFIGPDPIGLMGGSNLHQYAPNPSRWIDPLGLSYCAFGNASKPRAPRPGKDIAVDADGMVKSQAGKQFPEGASTTVDPTKSPLSGHYHEIPEGTKMPSGIDIVRDGSDVIPNSPRGPGHATVFPTRDMPFTEFQALFESLPWQHAGKK
jgi:RHS repeat-associated protein